MQARVCVGAADDFARAVDRLQHIKKEMQEGELRMVQRHMAERHEGIGLLSKQLTAAIPKVISVVVAIDGTDDELHAGAVDLRDRLNKMMSLGYVDTGVEPVTSAARGSDADYELQDEPRPAAEPEPDTTKQLPAAAPASAPEAPLPAAAPVPAPEAPRLISEHEDKPALQSSAKAPTSAPAPARVDAEEQKRSSLPREKAVAKEAEQEAATLVKASAEAEAEAAAKAAAMASNQRDGKEAREMVALRKTAHGSPASDVEAPTPARSVEASSATPESAREAGTAMPPAPLMTSTMSDRALKPGCINPPGRRLSAPPAGSPPVLSEAVLTPGLRLPPPRARARAVLRETLSFSKLSFSRGRPATAAPGPEPAPAPPPPPRPSSAQNLQRSPSALAAAFARVGAKTPDVPSMESVSGSPDPYDEQEAGQLTSTEKRSKMRV